MATRSDTELESAADLVEYERTMLVETFAELADNRLLDDALLTTSNNAHLESFLLHVRNLWDFLESTGSGDDVRAEDFTPGWAPNSTLEKDIRTQINKRLAHISYRRINYEDDKGWLIGELARNLTATFNAFLSDLDPARRNWFGHDDNPETFDTDLWGKS